MHRWKRALSLLLTLAMLLSTAVGAAEADTIDEILLPEEAEPAAAAGEASPEEEACTPAPTPDSWEQPEPTAASEPTATPEPTAAPEPTATPDPWSEPMPTAPEPTAASEPTATPDPWSEPMPIAPEPELRVEPELAVEESWSYDAGARELIIPCLPDARELVFRWKFNGDAAGYRVEIGPEGAECGQESLTEIECAEPCLTLEIADYLQGAYRLCIHAVLEDGSERTRAYSFRLETATDPAEEDASDEGGEWEEQVLSQGGVIVTGRMPVGAELTVEAVPTEDLKDFAGAGRTIVFAYEIGISANGAAYVPEEALTVTVALDEIAFASLDVLEIAETDGVPSARTVAEGVPVRSAIEFAAERLGVFLGAADAQPMPTGADYLLASNSIRIYSQGSRDYIGETSCLQQYGLQRAGCGVFAVAHALQWMDCDSWSGLEDFLDQIADLTHPAEYGYGFAEGVNEIYPDFTLGAISPNEGAAKYYSSLRALFAAGGCGMFSYEGHYILVIGFSSDGSKIHVIDSSSGSTLSHLGAYQAYYCDPLSKQWVTISPLRNGAWDVPGRYSASGTWTGMKSYGREYWVDREYVYSGNQAWYGGVPMITFTPGKAPERRLYTTVGRESCVYQMTGSDTLYAEPFDSAEAVDALRPGDRIVSSELVDNGADCWLRIEERIDADGEAVAYDAAFIRAECGDVQRLAFVEDRPDVAWTDGNIDGASITGTTSITGTISCADRMTKITAEFRRDGARWGDAVSVTPTANRQYSYSLHGSTLDVGLPFGSLPDGDYQLVFTVDYVYNRGQSSGTETISADFSRTNSPVAPPAPAHDAEADGPWTYQVLAEGGLNMRGGAAIDAALVTTLWKSATVAVTRKVAADGYVWGYGTAGSGETGWIVVDNEWTLLLGGEGAGSAPGAA